MKQFIITIILLFTVACSSSTKGSWNCPTLDGGKGSCISIKEADIFEDSTLEDHSNFSYLNSQQNIEIKLVAPKLKELEKFGYSKSPDKNKDSQISVGHKLRTQEKVGRIWFAPRIDSNGYQHLENVIYVVDEESKWVMQK